MKTLLKLLIAVAILNAVVRVGLATASYYQFKDQAQQLITFGADASVTELQEQMLERAATLDLPVTAEDIDVTRQGKRTAASAAYTQPVEVFPSYRYPISFQFTVEGLNLAGLGVAPVRRGR
jgi:hypothetical protein